MNPRYIRLTQAVTGEPLYVMVSWITYWCPPLDSDLLPNDVENGAKEKWSRVYISGSKGILVKESNDDIAGLVL